MRLLLATIFFAIIVGAFATSDAERIQQNKFTDWMRRHNKVYGPNDFHQRWQNWKNTDNIINNHNANPGTYLRGHNTFSDLTTQEFTTMFTGGKIPQGTRAAEDAQTQETRAVKRWAPGTALDYRGWGYVTGVKDQGQCGSCWAFSTTGATEGFWARYHGALPNLSEQELVDCANPNCYGCNGGWPASAMGWIAANGGIDTEGSYPYFSGTTYNAGTCQGGANSGVTLNGPVSLSADLKSALDNYGPVSVAVDASMWSSYTSGVFACPGQTPSIDHAVLAVGYGNDGTNDYWLIKNSWNTWWGESGYIRLLANSYYGADCGVTLYVTRAN